MAVAAHGTGGDEAASVPTSSAGAKLIEDAGMNRFLKKVICFSSGGSFLDG